MIRRNFLLGLVAAPVVVQSASLMKLSGIIQPSQFMDLMNVDGEIISSLTVEENIKHTWAGKPGWLAFPEFAKYRGVANRVILTGFGKYDLQPVNLSPEIYTGIGVTPLVNITFTP